MIPIEIKSGKTITHDYFKGLDYYQKLAGTRAAHSILVYGGASEQKRSNCHVIPWPLLDKMDI